MLEALYLAAALERSGNPVLLEKPFVAPIYATATSFSPQIDLPIKIALTATPITYLTLEDQRIFDKALRRSTRLVHKAVSVS